MDAQNIAVALHIVKPVCLFPELLYTALMTCWYQPKATSVDLYE